jgi:predicted O-methyltransferase YrrM
VTDAEIQTYIARAPAARLDKPTLSAMSSLIKGRDGVVLLGFNDYAKHLINMFGAAIASVIDDRYQGLDFRGTAVVAAEDTLPEAQCFLICDYDRFYDYKARYYAEAAARRIPFLFPDKYGTETTKVVDFARLDPVHQAIRAGREAAPASMLSEDGLFFTLEMLRGCMMLDGDVAEVGAWQGGSAWYLARMLDQYGSDKRLHVFEMGETLAQNNPQGIVCEAQMRRDLGFYPHAECHFGPATPHLEALHEQGARFSFIFLDFGFSERILSLCYEALVPGGVLLLDNYGHALGHPDMFDQFFAERGTTAIRMARSPVAFSIKR